MATAAKLAWTGIAMGVVHVLTGPDHISALATLSSSSSSSSRWYLFGLGARWGIGHGTGLLLVGGIFVLRDVLERSAGDDDDARVVAIPPAVTTVFQSLVGIFMVLLGLHGIAEARRNRDLGYAPVLDRDDDHDDDDDDVDDGSFEREPSKRSLAPMEVEGGDDDESPDDREAFDDDLEEFRYNVQLMFGTVSTRGEDDDGGGGGGGGPPSYRHHHHHHHRHGDDDGNSPFLALCAGIFHGLAGPGGVLGVVPAIQLHDAGLAACYLLSFCASSTVTMGIFASLYGTATASLAGWCGGASGGAENGGAVALVVEFRIRCASASLSVLVGAVWLALLAAGKLEDVFGA